jgi:hypothetical protein
VKAAVNNSEWVDAQQKSFASAIAEAKAEEEAAKKEAKNAGGNSRK